MSEFAIILPGSFRKPARSGTQGAQLLCSELDAIPIEAVTMSMHDNGAECKVGHTHGAQMHK
jgi:hypothetical protein